MTVRKETLNGQDVLVADLPNGGVKVVFPDGKIMFGQPVVQKWEFAAVLKYNPYHGEGGRFASADSATFVSTTNAKTLANMKAKYNETKLSARQSLAQPLPPGVAPTAANQTRPDLVGANALKLNESLSKVGLSISLAGDFGRTFSLSGDGKAATGFRLAVTAIEGAVKSLPPDVQSALREIGGKVSASMFGTGSSGKANIGRHVFAINPIVLVDRMEGTEKKSSVEDLSKHAKEGAAFNYSSSAFKDYNGSNRAEVVLAAAQSTARHEIGHLLTTTDTVRAYKSMMAEHPQTYGWVAKNISAYATTSSVEMIAEAFNKYHAPDYVKGSLPQHWEKLVESMPTHAREAIRSKKTSSDTDVEFEPEYPFMSPEWWAFTDDEDSQVPDDGEEGETQKFNPYHGEGGRFASSDSAASVQSIAPIGVQFVSPNIKEGTTMGYANSAIHSDEQKQFAAAFEKVDAMLGTEGFHQSALGAWSDGAENSLIQLTANNLPLDLLQVSAAMKGQLAEQKAVIAFKTGPGDAKVHTFDSPIPDPKVLSEMLVHAGIPYHSLVPQGTGFQVMAFNENSKSKEGMALSHNITKAAKAFGSTEHQYMKGSGGLIGSWNTREEGSAEYKKIIDPYLDKHPETKVKWDQLVQSTQPRVSKFASLLKGVQNGNR